MDIEIASKIRELENSIQSYQFRVAALESLLSSPRVRFENFEGCFKTFSTVPTNAADFKNGTVFLSDVAAVRKIHAVINGAIYSATLT